MIRSASSLLARVAIVAALAVAPGASSAAPSVFLEELTWTEVRDAIASGATTAIVPVGGTEQSGAHMTLGKHNVRVRALAGRIASKLGNAIVAPVLAYVPEGSIDPPAGHMRYPGTLSVPADVFERTLEAAARSLKRAGFRDIVFLGDHGGTQASLQAVAKRLDRAWSSTPVRAHAIIEYYRATETTYRRALAARGHSDAEIGTHAGLADTSLSLAVDAGIVRAEALKAPPRAADGTSGDPRASTKELGQPGVDAVVEASVEAIRRATRR